MFQKVIGIIKDSAISDKEAFFDFVEIIQNMDDEIDEKIVPSNLMSISTKYLVDFVKKIGKMWKVINIQKWKIIVCQMTKKTSFEWK